MLIEKLNELGNNLIKKGLFNKLEFTKPIPESRIKEIESEKAIKLPLDFKEVVTKMASSCVFHWAGKEPDFPDKFNKVTSGGADFIWDIEQVENIEDFVIADYGFDPNYIFAFMWTGSGDIFAFDTTNGLENSPVIYIKYDGGEVGDFPEDDKRCLHGYRLGHNFTDFMSRWIDLGCPGNEYDKLVPFYDYENNVLKDKADIDIEAWITWLNN